MRTYVRNPDRDQTGMKELYRTRTSKEWDLSFNFPADGLCCAQSIVITVQDFIKKHEGLVKYVLVSGIERGTNNRSTTTMDEHHVHCALITTEHMTRDQALRCFELDEVHEHNKFKRFAAPRDTKYPYSGWKYHHTKLDTKIDQTSLILFEHGTLPTDDTSTADKVKLINTLNKRYNPHYIKKADQPKEIKIKAVKEKVIKPKKTRDSVKSRKGYFAYLNKQTRKYKC